MATATMGLRRRCPQGPSPSPAGGKRTRAENNNSPSQGNLNEPSAKRPRSGSSRIAAARAKELEKKVTPPHWSDTRQFASIAGLSLQAQAALCSEAVSLPSPISYVASRVAGFVGKAAYLDLPGPAWPAETPAAAELALGFPFAAGPSTAQQRRGASPAEEETGARLPRRFPDDGMYAAYQPWVIRTYGDLAKTKTITIKKYARILRTLRGEEANSAENSKFRFWVKSKGFHIGQPDGYDAKPADRIVGRHAVTSPGLDPPLYVPTQPPHNKNLNGAEGTVASGRVYKKVAIVENFFDIIHAVHVDLEGRPGKHAGQKRTYRTITETYAFLPREAVTRFLLGCTECQRRPRTPSPTSTATMARKSTTPSPAPTTATPPPAQADVKCETPSSPKPATTLSSAASADEEEGSEKPREASHPPESKTPDVKVEKEDEPKSTVAATESAATATSADAQPKSEGHSGSVACGELTVPSEPCASSSSVVVKPKVRDEKYNPLSITNLLRKDPVKRRSPPIMSTALQPYPEPYVVPPAATAATAAAVPVTTIDGRSLSPPSTGYAHAKKQRILCDDRSRRSTPSPRTQPQSPCGKIAIAPVPLEHGLSIPQLTDLVQPRTIDGDADGQDGIFSPAQGLIDTNLNLLATIQQLHCQVMLALTERLRPPTAGSPSLASAASGASGPADS